MSLVFKNSTASVPQKRVVSIDGQDYLVAEVVRIAQEAGNASVTAEHSETLEPCVAPAPAAPAKPALITPA